MKPVCVYKTIFTASVMKDHLSWENTHLMVVLCRLHLPYRTRSLPVFRSTSWPSWLTTPTPGPRSSGWSKSSFVSSTSSCTCQSPRSSWVASCRLRTIAPIKRSAKSCHDRLSTLLPFYLWGEPPVLVDYMDLDARCSQKAVKLNHSLVLMDSPHKGPLARALVFSLTLA